MDYFILSAVFALVGVWFFGVSKRLAVISTVTVALAEMAVDNNVV